MDPHQTTAAVLAVIFLGSLVRSTFGFGDALVSMPLLALVVDDIKIAAPLIAFVSLTIAATVTLRDWRSIHFKSAAWLFVSSAAGIPIGLYFLTSVDERYVKLVLAVLLLAFSTFVLTRARSLKLGSDKPAFLFGFVAGVLGGAYHTPGPPLVAFGTLRQWSAERFRATLQGYFLPTSVLIITGHGFAGLWQPCVFYYFLWSLPLVFLAIWLGRFLNKRFNTHQFLRYVHVLLILLGCALLFDSLRKMLPIAE